LYIKRPNCNWITKNYPVLFGKNQFQVLLSFAVSACTPNFPGTNCKKNTLLCFVTSHTSFFANTASVCLPVNYDPGSSPISFDIMKEECKQIVLIGGGYASIWAYRSIVEELMIEMMMGRIRIRVICPENFHFFHGWTAETLTGIIQDQNRMSLLSEIFQHAEIIKGRAVFLDTISKTVFVDMNDGSKWAVPYDQLLLGIGTVDAMSVDGMAEHAYQLKSYKAYQMTKMRIQFLVRQAAESDSVTAHSMLRFVVAGAGFTGVEIAANLAEMIMISKKQYPGLRNIKPSIKLINSRSEILPGLHKGFGRIRAYAQKTLQQYGIEMIDQTKIIRVTSKGALLSDGSFVDSRMVISTIGQLQIDLDGTQYMDRDVTKKIITNSFLQVNNHDNIWGAGDFVHVTHCKSKTACPPNALWAIKQGAHAGRNIARAILSQSLKPFTYRGLGQCASLGIGKGMGELFGIQFTGWPAWIMRWFFFQHYMPSKKMMWFEIKDWLHLLFTRMRKDFRPISNDIRNSFSRESFRFDLKQTVYKN
jgi:NADH dehydrogenase